MSRLVAGLSRTAESSTCQCGPIRNSRGRAAYLSTTPYGAQSSRPAAGRSHTGIAISSLVDPCDSALPPFRSYTLTSPQRDQSITETPPWSHQDSSSTTTPLPPLWQYVTRVGESVEGKVRLKGFLATAIKERLDLHDEDTRRFYEDVTGLGIEDLEKLIFDMFLYLITKIDKKVDIPGSGESQPSAAFATAVRQVCWHFLIQPGYSDYDGVLPLVKDWIWDHADKFQLEELVRKGAAAKAETNKKIGRLFSEAKIAFRKSIFQSIKPGSNFKDLDSFALDIYTKRFMDKEGAYTAIPKEFPLIEHLALLRKIARPILASGKTNRLDTGFWEEYHIVVSRQEAAHGSDRNSAAWVAWLAGIVDEDRRIHPSGSSGGQLLLASRGAEGLLSSASTDCASPQLHPISNRHNGRDLYGSVLPGNSLVVPDEEMHEQPYNGISFRYETGNSSTSLGMSSLRDQDCFRPNHPNRFAPLPGPNVPDVTSIASFGLRPVSPLRTAGWRSSGGYRSIYDA